MKIDSELSVVILAAGKGTRMKSNRAKVLHEVFFRPMLHHVLDAAKALEPKQMLVIAGHQEEVVRSSLQSHDVEIVRQEKQLGTGHAVQMTESVIDGDEGLVMILCGDTPLITSQALEEMYRQHLAAESDLTVMTTLLDNPFGYGRIIIGRNGVQAIVEEKEADEEQKKIREINAGIYLVDRKFLFEALATVTPNNTQGEFYLTDIVGYCVSVGGRVGTYLNPNPQDVLGVNSRVELEAANMELQHKRNVGLMQTGVTVHNSGTVSVSPSAEIKGDTVLMQNIRISGISRIGESCTIETGAVLHDCIIGNNATIGANSVLKRCRIKDNVQIQPLTRATDTEFGE